MKTKKKDAFEKTKIVIRHLPPSLSQSNLLSQFDHLFSNRYSWFRFHPGKPSQKNQRCSRAYIDFNTPGDVLEFADFFHGHVFVNEKGSQFKAIVEYAPSQRVPKSCVRKDAREGAIYKDPDYLEFLKHIAKPVENLPSAEIQLERKEAEQSGAEKAPPIATPLMEFVRQKRAAEGVNQGLSASHKISKRVGPAALAKRAVGSTKRNSDKKKYIPKDSRKNTNRRDKPVVITHRHEEHLATSRGKHGSEVKPGSNQKAPCIADSVMKKLLLRGKEHEISLVPQDMLQLSGPKSGTGNSPAPAPAPPAAAAAASKVNQRHKTVTRGEQKDKADQGNNIEETRLSTGSDGSPIEYGSNMNFGSHGKAYYNVKADVSVRTSKGKPPKRGGAIGPTAAEKQVWVQKPTSSS